MRIRVLVSVLALSHVPSSEAQQTPRAAYCLWNGVASVPGPHRYMDRGGRCEGLYAKLAGEAGTLTLVSVIRLPRVADSTSEVTMSWPASPRDSLWLLSESIDPHVPYRMSSLRAGADNRFQWSLELAQSEGLSLSRLSTLAWRDRSFADGPERIYIPIDISTAGSRVTHDSAVATVIPSVELRSLQVSVGVVGSDGGIVRWLFQDRSLEHSYYPRDEPVTVVLPRQGRQTLLRVQLAGQAVNGAPLSTEFLVSLGAS